MDALRVTHDGRMTGQYGSSNGDWRAVVEACDMDASGELVSRIVRVEHNFLAHTIFWYADGLTVLRDLRSRGVDLGVISNCYFATRDLISQSRLPSNVDAIVLSCEAGYQKPEPEIYLKAADQLGHEPSGILYVDDSENACEGASRVGMKVVHLTRSSDWPRGSGSQFETIDNLETDDLFCRAPG